MADVTSPFGFPYPEDTDLVRNGAADIEALAQAANDQFSAGFQFAGQRIYESDGTFAKADPLGTGDIGLRAIRVKVVAGGGGGAACDTGGNSVAGGGGGGGFAESFITDVAALDASVAVDVGGGGAGGVAPGGVGSVGGVSSFGSLVSANGGAGQANFSRGGAGGIATAGLLKIRGGGGGAAVVGDLSTTRPQLGGFGGSTQLSGQTPPTIPFAGGIIGLSGQAFGGGGAGAVTTSNTAAFNGGPGADGVVIVEVFV